MGLAGRCCASTSKVYRNPFLGRMREWCGHLKSAYKHTVIVIENFQPYQGDKVS